MSAFDCTVYVFRKKNSKILDMPIEVSLGWIVSIVWLPMALVARIVANFFGNPKPADSCAKLLACQY
jgi:hypothetical protein